MMIIFVSSISALSPFYWLVSGLDCTLSLLLPTQLIYKKKRMPPFGLKPCLFMCSSPSSRTTTTTRPTGIHCSDQAPSRLVSTQHVNAQQQSDTTTTPINQKLHIRLVPHVNHDMPCHVFPVMERDLSNGTVLKLGRYNDARTAGHHLSFKSKVVSRHHAKMWCENGKVQ